MKKITIWHGSEKIIQKPLYGRGKIHNDYGIGFYCTEDLELAKELACKGMGENGFANKYAVDLEGLNILDLSGDKYNVLNWLAILAYNRDFKVTFPTAGKAKEYLINNFLIDTNNYDIIKGYRADDSYFAFARAFINNQISLSELEKAMRLGNLGEQIVIKSKRAFDRIKYSGYEIAESNKYYHKRLKRNLKANNEFVSLLENTEMYGLRIIDIMREEIKDGDERLR